MYLDSLRVWLHCSCERSWHDGEGVNLQSTVFVHENRPRATVKSSVSQKQLQFEGASPALSSHSIVTCPLLHVDLLLRQSLCQLTRVSLGVVQGAVAASSARCITYWYVRQPNLLFAARISSSQNNRKLDGNLHCTIIGTCCRRSATCHRT